MRPVSARIDGHAVTAHGPAMQTALIVGASRGIGLELARTLAARGWAVVGTVRNEAGAEPLRAAGIATETLDVSDPAGPGALRERLAGRVLDLMVLNAGRLGPDHQSAAQTTPDEAAALFLTNAIGPVRVARAVQDLVPDGGAVTFVTSRMGSVGLNTDGELELYRASKAALNSLAQSFLARLARPVTVLLLHPGWVRTAMGGPDASLDPAESARGMLDVIEARRRTGEHGFVDQAGTALPW